MQGVILGVALSITAFPMMARILEENKITHTSFGTLSLAAGACGDLLSWVVLAIVLSCIKANVYIALITISAIFIYLLIILMIKNPLRKLLMDATNNQIHVNTKIIALVLAFIMLSAWFTERAGIHLIFGAFIAGLIMPRQNGFTRALIAKIKVLTITLFLPVFFVYTGLNTKIGLIDSSSAVLVFIIVTLIAIIGKGLGCAIVAVFSGETWRDALSIGILMNARGLMELIVLNIGLQANIITEKLFTILVLMTVITTLMTTPLYNLVYKKSGKSAQKKTLEKIRVGVINDDN